MAIAGSPGVPSAGFCIRNRQLVQIGTVANKPAAVVMDPDAAATALLFSPGSVVQLDVRRGTAETVVRLHLEGLGVIDADHRSNGNG